ncbi:MAG: alpha/beta fold hydrolase [Candidatus Thalassarchaeaceae archaeon]
MTSGNLVMLHGMTGTSEKMQPLAESLAPNGWNIICPQAEIEHPTRGGFAWWLRAEDPTLPLNSESQKQVEDSMQSVIREIPNGPVIIGGFSQGGAIASALLETELHERILGLVLIGTKTVRPDFLRETLPFLKPREVVWMHGRKDHLVPLEVAKEHAEIYESAGWPVTRLEHEKGHMVNLNQLDELKNSIQRMADSI